MSTALPAGHRLILASTSPRRQELIAVLGLPVTVRPSHADENTPVHWPPGTVVEELAQRKAKAVWEAERGAAAAGVVIGSDTVVELDGEILGKPGDEEEAFIMLSRLAGRTHRVYTGVCCIGLADGRTAVSHRVTEVTMRRLTPDRLRRYIASGEPMDKAGAYGIQGLGAVLVDSINGDYFNVVGLPVSHLAEMLESFGICVP